MNVTNTFEIAPKITLTVNVLRAIKKTANADGVIISIEPELIDHVEAEIIVKGKKMGRAGKVRWLNEDNKFDAVHTAKGAVAILGHQPMSEGTANKVQGFIDATIEEATTEEWSKIKEKQDENKRVSNEVEGRVESTREAVAKMMNQ